MLVHSLQHSVALTETSEDPADTFARDDWERNLYENLGQKLIVCALPGPMLIFSRLTSH